MVYENAVPADRVAQIHIAGRSKGEQYIFYTHDHPVLDPVWSHTLETSSAAARPPRLWNGTITFRAATKYMQKDNKGVMTEESKVDQGAVNATYCKG